MKDSFFLAGLVVAVVLVACVAEAAPVPPVFRPNILQRQKSRVSSSSSSVAAPPPYKTYYFTQNLDHFAFNSDATFQQRYLVADQYWNTNGTLSNGCPGPILFYTGNEGDITLFYDNTGFVTEVLGPQLGGLIIFAEHRYYGETLPFGSKSFEPKNVIYLTSEQALADYAILIENLRNTLPGAAKCPFISFGGSYGGMLSSWFRMKYPNVVAGALAASAPIVQFFGTGVSEYVFNQITTTDYTNAVPGCSSQIQQALFQIPKLGSTASGRDSLVKAFSLCGPLNNEDDVVSFYQWIVSSLTNMAMVDYPYPADFLAPMPGWPVTVACKRMTSSNDSSTILTRLASTVAVFYNFTGQAGSCNNISNSGTPDLGDLGWSYQACTEMIMPIAANGKTDMFIPYPYNLTDYSSYCKQVWGAIPRAGWVPTYYGGFNISTATNIVFSNGQLDPWRGGGIQSAQGLDPSVVAIIIEQGAHHLDLRSPNPADPSSVITARQIETQNIQKWINEYVSSHP